MAKLLFTKKDELLGTGICHIAWRPSGTLLAVAGSNNSLLVMDRRGELIEAQQLGAPIQSFAWDAEGDVLAVICDRVTGVLLVDVNTHQIDQLDLATGAKEIPLFIAWSPVSQLLAVGNNNGNLLIYDHQKQKKVPVLAKHQRRIVAGCITRQDQVVCGSDDATISVSSSEGDTVSAVLNSKLLLLCNLSETSSMTNLAFQDRYGNIVDYQWYGDGYLLVAFRNGFYVSISARSAEMGSELHAEQDFRTYMGGLAINFDQKVVATCGDNQIRVHSLPQYETNDILNMDTEKELTQIELSPDGKMAAVAGAAGFVAVYLLSITQLGAAYKDIVAVLSGLDEVMVLPEGDKAHARSVKVIAEPSILAVGPRHVAVAVTNAVWFYDYHLQPSRIEDAAPGPVARYEYLSSVQAVQLNRHFTIVFMEGRVRLHAILEDDEHLRSLLGVDAAAAPLAASFPEQERGADTRIVSCALTDEFLVFATTTNYIVYFGLAEWAIVSEFRHSVAIKRIVVEPAGVRACLFDDRMDTYIYSPVDDSLNKLPPIGATVQYRGALWETFTIDRDTFVVYDSAHLYVFLLSRNEIGGEGISFMGSTKLDFGHTPLMLSKGIVQCLTSNGKTSGVLLSSHMTDNVFDKKGHEEMIKLLNQAIGLKRWAYAFRLCDFARRDEMWRQLGLALLRNSQVGLGKRAFRQIGDVGMVWALEDLEMVEEKALRAGHIAVLLGEFDTAEKLFLESSQPIEALQLRRDLLHWPRALTLSGILAPEQAAFISKEYAMQLEFNGEYAAALQHYEDGELKEEKDSASDEVLEHNEVCRSGIARMSIRTGDLRRGVEMARQVDGRVVKRDCAVILEELKQYSDAALLFELGRYYDRAAAVCLKSKNWAKVAELLPNVRSPKIHSQFGHVMESEKKFKQAAIAYKDARDYDNLVRVLLEHLGMPEEAVQIVRESRSAEGAKLVAKFFMKLGDHASAIHFLVMSQCHHEAFHLAETSNKMEDYAEALGKNGTHDEYTQLAEYFASQDKALEAGRFHLLAGNHQMAMNLLLSPGLEESAEAVKLAIECCVSSRDATQLHRLTSYLMGDADGRPKDPRHIFRMFVAFNMTKEAAKTAVVIARDEQERGSYKVARDLLFAMYKDLHSKGLRVPQLMDNALMLLHSYMIVKSMIGRGEVMQAARMLIRVSANVSSFPQHVVQILTSSVVMCTKAGLRSSAYSFAVQLMAPELRGHIDAKYKKKIEQIVRKSGGLSDPEEARDPCPRCSKPLAQSVLLCTHCKSALPYCIVTGRHIVAADFSTCPSCDFPGLYSEFRKLQSAKEPCPLCTNPLSDVTAGDAAAFFDRDGRREDIDIAFE